MIEGTAGANSLVRALMRSVSGPWQDHLEVVRLSLGEMLHEPFALRDFVYFPLTAAIALLHVLEDGGTAEIAVVGPEGVVNLSPFMGDDISFGSAMVQCAGFALRLRSDLLKQVVESNAQAARLLVRYSQTLKAQMAQTAVCNRRHPIHQRLCRWILLMLDRRVGSGVPMTEELLATMLGFQKASVSDAAADLQNEGLITFGRGRITVLNRPAMERRVCECYAVIRSEHDRLLPDLDAVFAAGAASSNLEAQKKTP